MIFTHGLATIGSRPDPYRESLGCAGEDMTLWPDSPIIKILAKNVCYSGRI